LRTRDGDTRRPAAASDRTSSRLSCSDACFIRIPTQRRMSASARIN
jgi:hypothetical protein